MPADLRKLADAVRYERTRPRTTFVDQANAVRDAQIAERALCDAILSSGAVDVVEAVRALGVARSQEPQTEPLYAWEDAVNAIADRLAADAAGKDGR